MSESFASGLGVCADCGGDLKVIDKPPTDNSIVTCKSCGKEIGTYNEVHSQIATAVVDYAKSIRDKSIADFRRGIRNIGKRR